MRISDWSSDVCSSDLARDDRCLPFWPIGGCSTDGQESGMNERKKTPWDWLLVPAPHLERFARAGLWDERTIADQAHALAADDPDAVAIVDGDRVITRAALLADAEALATAMYDRGLRPGDVIAFQLTNWPEAAVVNLAAALGGMIVPG